MSLRAKLLRPRHVAASVLLSLVLGGFGLGLAAATHHEAAAPEASTPFMVPAPKVGDHGIYTLKTQAGEYWPPSIEFQWLEDGEGFDAHGARVVVNRLLLAKQSWYVDETGKPYPGWSNETLEFLAGTTTSAARHFEDSRQDAVSSWLPGTSETVHDTTWESWAFGSESSELRWCGLRNELQANPVHLSAPIPFTVPCWNGPHTSYSLVGNVTGVSGAPPARSVQVLVARVHEGRVSPLQNLTFREDVPYPVRMQFLAGPGAVYELEAFARGSVPLAAEAPPLSPSPPAVVLAKRQVWGPDEAGVPHPFPASAAFAMARDDPSFPDLREYLARHPEAYVATAGYQEGRLNHEVDRAWVMVVTDGATKFPFSVHVRDLADPPVPTPHLRTHYRTDVTWGKDTKYLPAGQAPAELPTVASLMAAWAHLDGSPAGRANGWGWDLGLHCRDGECRHNGYAYSAGRVDDVATGLPAFPVVGMNRTIGQTKAYFGITGDLAGYGRSTSQQYERFGPLSGASGSPERGESASFAPLSSFAPAPLGWLATPQAAAAGAMAFLAGILYWLWPALKAGPLALFSRVREDQVLDQPLRRSIHQRIEAQPGIHHQELVRAVGRGQGTVEHHLGKLLDASLVTRVQGKGYTCYFPKGAVDYRVMASAPLLKSPVARSIVATVRQRPGIRSSELARELDVTPATIHYHVERLRTAKVLEGSLVAGALRLHPAEQAA